jgi:GR25 family glycosyltransferase involved in LPS biosynthesis
MRKNYKTIPVFVLTLKDSLREKILRKRLNLLDVNYKIFYAINGKEKKNFKILNRFYDSVKSRQTIGRDMTFTEISNAEGHLRIYKYIIKKKISNAVIMEDDCWPSKILSQWLELGFFFSKQSYDIIQIYHSFGLIYKRPVKIISKIFSIHRCCFTLPYTTCYQISLKACNYIIKNNRKITQLVDWPIYFHKGKIKQFAVLPYLVSLQYNHFSTSYQGNLWKKFHILQNLKKIVPFYNFITALYFLSHIPFFFRLHKNYSYYKEKYLLRKIYYLKNLFFNNYIDLSNTFKNNHFYPSDLKKNLAKLRVF